MPNVKPTVTRATKLATMPAMTVTCRKQQLPVTPVPTKPAAPKLETSNK